MRLRVFALPSSPSLVPSPLRHTYPVTYTPPRSSEDTLARHPIVLPRSGVLSPRRTTLHSRCLRPSPASRVGTRSHQARLRARTRPSLHLRPFSQARSGTYAQSCTWYAQLCAEAAAGRDVNTGPDVPPMYRGGEGFGRNRPQAARCMVLRIWLDWTLERNCVRYNLLRGNS